MAQLIVRDVATQVVDELKQRAASNGRSVEAEHREILRETLLDDAGDFVSRARALRNRLRSTVDRTETTRSYRDRDNSS